MQGPVRRPAPPRAIQREHGAHTVVAAIGSVSSYLADEAIAQFGNPPHTTPPPPPMISKCETRCAKFRRFQYTGDTS